MSEAFSYARCSNLRRLISRTASPDTSDRTLFAACTLVTDGNDAECADGRAILTRNIIRVTEIEASEATILVSEGTTPGYRWRQYQVITDGRVVIVELLPALLYGWKFHRVTVQSSEDWPNMTRDQIVAYRLADAHPAAMAGDLGEFREKLLAVAASGTLPERA